MVVKLVLSLLEGNRELRVFENKVLRKIFGTKRDEVTGEWTKLHNAELHALYSSPDIIRNIKSRLLRWAGHVACMGESKDAYRVLFGRPEVIRTLGMPRRWENNIKMDLREMGYDGVRKDGNRWDRNPGCRVAVQTPPSRDLLCVDPYVAQQLPSMENKGVRSKDMEKHRWGSQGWNPAVEPKKKKKKKKKEEEEEEEELGFNNS
ncbi:hypothetical protein ANN_06431 [Periplaneta americana]|uniref:Uncharacterized protein n=1 Tax=Periplaneta americana TaxID=6978 RepID=A0ABQ8TFK6_PERAM|nr:hypothetical protein ANN_06431 [Periplaneta americana]